MLKVLFYLPTIIVQFVHSVLPRRLFIRLYKPSTVLERDLEHKIRNSSNLTAYYTKRALRGSE